MLRLVSQFDNEKMRASVATPTCGPCCSCCCCCIVTTLASSIITARNLGKVLDTSVAGQTVPNQTKPSKGQAYLMGFFLLPIALGIGFLIVYRGDFIFALVVTTVIFGGGLYVFHHKYGLPSGVATSIFIWTAIALVLELFAWIFLVFGS